MDMGSASVDDKHQVGPQTVNHGDADDHDHGDHDDEDEGSCEIRNNGSLCGNEAENVADNTRVNHADTEQKLVDSSLPAVVSPGGGGGSNPAVKRPLRKWRRIRRDVAKDDSDNVVNDTSKVLKRGLSGNGNPVKTRTNNSHSQPIEMRNNSEGSVGSVNMLRNVGVVDGFAIHGSSSDSRFAVGSAFAGGADSENSEDRSSKSSTAASVPKAKYDLPPVLGHAWERNRVKSSSTKSFSSSAQRAQQGRAQMESSKKHRGDRVRIEQENSYSSVESDSRSSNFVFMQSATLTNNGKQSERSMSHEGENSDDAHASEQQYSEEVQTGFRKENVGEVEDFTQDGFPADLPWNVNGGENKNRRSLADQDPLVESILNLQSVQEALAKEVQKFGEIGKDTLSPSDNSVKGGIPAGLFSGDLGLNESNLSDHFGFENIGQTSSKPLEAQVLVLKQNVKFLESKLDETRAMLEVKESRVAELEDMINISKFTKEESGSTMGLEEDKCRELETEVEGLFRQMIEAQVEYIALKRTTQRLKFAAGGQIELLDEQEAVAGEQALMLNKLGEAEIRASKLRKQAEELRKYDGDIVATEEIFTMQKRFCKITSCIFIQLILLGLVVWSFFPQSPHQGAAVPT